MPPTDRGAADASDDVSDDVQVVELSDDETGDRSGDRVAERAPVGPAVRWSWALIAGIIVVVLVVAATVGGGLATRRQATAATVNGNGITVDEIDALVDAYRKNPQLAPQFLTNGRVTSDRTARLLQQLVVDRVIRVELGRRRALPSAAQVAQVRAALVAQNDPQLVKGFSKQFLDAAAQRSADVEALSRVVGPDPDGSKLNNLLDGLLRRAKVSVDPRYGTYAPNVSTGVVIVAPPVPSVRNERTAPTTAVANPLGG